MRKHLAAVGFFSALAITGVMTLTLTTDNITPERGKGLQLSCLTSGEFTTGTLNWFPPPPKDRLSVCFSSVKQCSGNTSSYRFTADSKGGYAYINSLSRENDTGTWKCAADLNESANIEIKVYTIPSRLSITQTPVQDVDLSVNSVVLQCKTVGCTYPMPTVIWIFKDQSTSEYVYSKSNPSGKQETCTGPEMIYTSTLTLPQYTAFNDSSDKTGTFLCRIEYPDPSRNINSLESNAVTFADQPSLPSVQTVQANNFPWLENQTGTLQCVMADPGNPKASVKWTSSRGTTDMDGNLMFRNLSATDHGQPVYCQVQNNFTDLKGLTVASPTILLNVEYRPSVTLIPSVQPLRINEGSNLTVTCMASGNPLPIVQWKNSNPPSNTLFIPNITRNNTGSYTCVASSTSTNYNRVVLQREETTTIIVEYSMYAPSVSDSAQFGLSVGGGVGIGVGCFVLGCIVTFIAFTIRRQLNVSKNSCFRSKGNTDDATPTYSNTEMTSQPVKPIYEELSKGNVEHNMYDKIEHSADGT